MLAQTINKNRKYYNRGVVSLARAGQNLNITSDEIMNPLTFLITSSDEQGIRNAIDAGLDINLPGSWQVFYPIHIAALDGNLDMVKLLLELGADPSVKDYKNRTSLDLVEGDDAAEISAVLKASMK